MLVAQAHSFVYYVNIGIYIGIRKKQQKAYQHFLGGLIWGFSLLIFVILKHEIFNLLSEMKLSGGTSRYQ